MQNAQVSVANVGQPAIAPETSMPVGNPAVTSTASTGWTASAWRCSTAAIGLKPDPLPLDEALRLIGATVTLTPSGSARTRPGS